MSEIEIEIERKRDNVYDAKPAIGHEEGPMERTGQRFIRAFVVVVVVVVSAMCPAGEFVYKRDRKAPG